MALPTFTMRQLLEAGVHFGHQTHRWNPKMRDYIFGDRNNIHIIDLAQTVPMMHRMLQTVSDTVAGGGRVLFVGTKRQAAELVADAARRSAQYYVNSRWLGGTLTNWKTISHSIRRLRRVEEILSGETGELQALTKKEVLRLTRERDKLERDLGGIKDMGGQPDMIFVIDTNKESIAIREARRLNIPVAAIVDTNSDPEGIGYPVPGNDDAGRAIATYCDLVARAAIDGISRAQGDTGADVGEAAEPALEDAIEASTETAAGPVDEQAVEAEVAVAEPGGSELTFETLAAPRGAPDDLKRLPGLGPVIEQKLNDLGIFHFWQIAAFKPDDIERIEDELKIKGRIERDEWVPHAATLAETGE